MRLSEIFKGLLLGGGYVTSVRRLQAIAPELVAGADALPGAVDSASSPDHANGTAGLASASPRDACRCDPAIAGATR